MTRTMTLLAMAGATLVAAAGCSEQGGENNLAGDNALAIDSNLLANVAGDIAPVNGSSNVATVDDSSSGISEPAEKAGPAAPVRTPTPPASRPKPATEAAPADRPARTERTAPRPAPKQEPSPPPASTCTPEHEAMGHCKQ